MNWEMHLEQRWVKGWDEACWWYTKASAASGLAVYPSPLPGWVSSVFNVHIWPTVTLLVRMWLIDFRTIWPYLWKAVVTRFLPTCTIMTTKAVWKNKTPTKFGERCPKKKEKSTVVLNYEWMQRVLHSSLSAQSAPIEVGQICFPGNGFSV